MILTIESVKNESNAIYDHVQLKGIEIRSKCDWYEYGKNSIIFLKILEKITRRVKYNEKTYY